MQFRDLKKQYRVLKADIDAAMQRVAENCNFISGGEVAELERQLAEYVGAKYCISCANGTDALSIAMMVWGIGSGDAVFVPDFTFFSSGEIVSHCGAVPIFIDVCEETFNIDPDKLESAIINARQEGKYELKAVVAVDLFGLPADMPKIRAICDKYELLLLEDGAQGFGGRIGDKTACSFGDMSTTSFFPAKPLGCYGDGGALFTDNSEWAQAAMSIRVHGKGEMKYDNVRIGLNSRLDTIQAAILKVKFRAFTEYELTDVNKASEMYDKAFDGCDSMLARPVVPEGFYSSRAQYTLRLKDRETRDGLQAALKGDGIPTMVYYPKPMHRQLAFGIAGDTDNDLSVTNKLCDTVFSLPMHPYLTREDADIVAAAVIRYLR